MKVLGEAFSINYHTIRTRLREFGWTVAQAVETQVCVQITRTYIYEGNERSIREIGELCGIAAETLRGRIFSMGLSLQEAIDFKKGSRKCSKNS